MLNSFPRVTTQKDVPHFALTRSIEAVSLQRFRSEDTSRNPLVSSASPLEDLRVFLSKCRGVSDKEQFGKDDYWMPPEDFERSRKGDCDDFALYAWRQLLEMRIPARFVANAGYFGGRHAWVTFVKDGKHFLLEPQARFLGLRFPRLDGLGYKPDISVEWDGKQAHFYVHKERKFTPPIRQIPMLVLEWLFYRLRLFLKIAYWIPEVWRNLHIEKYLLTRRR